MAAGAKVAKHTTLVRATHATTIPAGDERRRQLKQALEENEITPAALARKAGFPTANAFYNFFAGKTKGLSLRTMLKILPHLPKSDADVLLGVSHNSTGLSERNRRGFDTLPPPISSRDRSIKHLRASTQDLKRGIVELHHTIGIWSQHVASIEARIDDLDAETSVRD